ncbi:class I SAM-dependent methyltransferase [Arsukibacterium indicum]|uniref:Methyltransferase n=1 Tax=Arsukibacterium indicum TaxID=2848612 RepID=A0ABS6MIZ5_9GAMM|nr:methyltransferase [Arsukibacterium indicum]MBV2128781.1 methyltransferase [Arsukibacterium indicum]
MKKTITNIVLTVGLTLAWQSLASEPDPRQKLSELALSNARSAEHISRNQYRNPADTLHFFGLKPDMAVLEVWPGRGWYTEILAPYLKEQGHFTIAQFRQDDGTFKDERAKFWARLSAALSEKISEQEDYFGTVHQIELEPPYFQPELAPEQFDMVLSFRNAHIWDENGHLLATLQSLYDLIKPGGVLGLVEHRAATLSDTTSVAVEGYLDEAYVIAAAEQVGFQLAARSEINANLLDTKDHPKGVYTLPPTLALGNYDREMYLAIGESDRMTLKFIKPEVQP